MSGTYAATEKEWEKQSEETRKLRKMNRKLNRTVFELAILHEIGKTINSTLDIEKVVSILLEMTRQTVNADKARMLVFQSGLEEPWINLAHAGHDGKPDFHRAERQLTDWVVRERTPVLYDPQEPVYFKNDPGVDWKHLGPAMAVPLIRQGRTIGVFLLSNNDRQNAFSRDDLRFVRTLADQAAIALENKQLVCNLQDHLADTVRALVTALEAQDRRNRGHSDRVAHYAVRMGQQLRLSGEDLRRLECLALLHDVGMLGIDGGILRKPGQLAPEDWTLVRQHPEMGAGIIGTIPFLEADRDAVRHHHEWYNGGGYPLGLSGESIPLMARIIGVADAFDAMTSERSFRPALSESAALTELHVQSGKQFDPVLVDAFLETHGARR